MSKNRHLCGLTMGIEQHRLINPRFGAGQKLIRHILIPSEEDKKTRAKLDPEHGVFHIIS